MHTFFSAAIADADSAATGFSGGQVPIYCGYVYCGQTYCGASI